MQGRGSIRPTARSATDSAERSSCRFAQSLVDVPEDIIERLEPDRQAHHFGQDPGGALLVLVELAMRRRGRVNHQRLGVPDVGEMREKLYRLDNALPGLRAALDAE